MTEGPVKPLKARLGVPRDLASCHTAQVGGYVIEGHVPAGAIKRLLVEKPKGTGLAVPGMPAGSPGMEVVRDTGGVLLDMQPDQGLVQEVRGIIEEQGDRVADLHVWRLGPGHLGAIVSVVTAQARGPDFYRRLLAPFGNLSHLTVEIRDVSRV